MRWGILVAVLLLILLCVAALPAEVHHLGDLRDLTFGVWSQGAFLAPPSVRVDEDGFPYAELRTNGLPHARATLELGGADLSHEAGLFLLLSSDGPTVFHVDIARRNSAWPGDKQIASTSTLAVEGERVRIFVPYADITVPAEDLAECGSCDPTFSFTDVAFVNLITHSGAASLRIHELGVYSLGSAEAEPALSASAWGSCADETVTGRQPLLVTAPAGSSLEYIGNPALDCYPNAEGQAYARSVWDMYAWEGKLYLGGGNSNNEGSAPNAGPVDLWSYDPNADSFERELTVDDEEIERFRAIDGRLCIPGHDARESWELGNLYVRNLEGWAKLRTLQNAVHVYDVASLDGRLFAAGAVVFPVEPPDAGGGIWASEDEGQTWTLARHYGPITANGEVRTSDPLDPGVWRFMTLVEFEGFLYASGWGCSRLYRLTEGRFSFVNVELFPGAESRYDEPPSELQLRGLSTAETRSLFADPLVGGFIARWAHYGSQLLYVGAVPALDHDWKAFGVYVASSLRDGRIQGLGFLKSDEEPRDVIANEKAAYVLATSSRTRGLFVSRVYVTHDMESWDALLAFETDASAYSIEVLDGSLYIGLGGDCPSSGAVFRLRLPQEQV